MPLPNFTIELLELVKTDLNDSKNAFAGKAQLLDKLTQQTAFLTSDFFDAAEKQEINRIFQSRKIILRLV